MIREYFQVHSSVTVAYRVPRSNPSVRERINLTNRTLLIAAGEIGLLVDRKCKELIKDFEQVAYKADIEPDRQRSGPACGRTVGCAGIPAVAGVPAGGGRSGERRERLL